MKVVIVGLDGVGSCYLSKGNGTPTMPFFESIRSKCLVHSYNARTIFPPVSAPVWTCILTGMLPHQHGIADNKWTPECPQLDCVSPHRAAAPGSACPRTLFDMLPLHKSSFAAVSWPWLRYLAATATATRPTGFVTIHNCEGDDELVFNKFQELDSLPDFSFLHFDTVDESGHMNGFGGREYLLACRRLDDILEQVKITIARLLQKDEPSADAAPPDDRGAVMIICSDHGGSGTDHGELVASHTDVPLAILHIGGEEEDTPSPLLSVSTPCCDGTEAALVLSGAEQQEEDLDIGPLDLAPTVCELLRIPTPKYMRGRSLVTRRP